jgi:hypothetical protein
MNAKLRKKLRREDGATAAETAITIMTFLMIILGIIQITLAIHARLLVNYAAYCAVRAGIVHNGDQHEMEKAAATALLPLFSNTGDYSGLAAGYAKARLAVQLGLIKVDVLSPNTSRFKKDERFFPEISRYAEKQKGKDAQKPDQNLLVVKVTHYYRLEIPYINRILRPVFPYLKISSIHRMRMQSDRRFR